jgi:hypothetical protein
MLILTFEQLLSYHLLKMITLILAIHLLVVCSLNAVISMDRLLAHVSQHTLDHHQTVDLSVRSTLNAQVTKLV